jgi:hypothetical protein
VDVSGQAGGSTARWQARRKLAWSIRVATVALPFAVATGFMIVVAHLVPRPAAGTSRIAWYSALLGVSWLIARVVGRAVDRSLPLAALLEMSLTFPESAPSRLGLAQRTSSRSALAQLRVSPPDETAQAAAERILRLLTALSAHDRFTRGHAERVRAYADLIAERLDMPAADRDRLGWAALLHDIGKLQVPSALGRAQAAPAAGSVIAAPLLAWLAPMEGVIIEHHERFDGSGYPAGLSGENISWGARVVSVADSFEAMTAARPYSRPMRREAALRELVDCAGSHFDPVVVRALLSVPQRRLAWAMGPAAWLTGLPLVGQGSLTVVRTAAGHAGSLTVGATAVVAAAVAPAAVFDQPTAYASPPATVTSSPSAAPATPSTHPRAITRTATSTQAAPPTAPTRATAAAPTGTPSHPTVKTSKPVSPTGTAGVGSPVVSAPSPSPAALPLTPLPAVPTIKPSAATPPPVAKPKPTRAPKPSPKPKPTKTPKQAKPTHKAKGAVLPTPTPKPTKSAKPTKTAKPTKPTPTAKPTPTPTPTPTSTPATNAALTDSAKPPKPPKK